MADLNRKRRAPLRSVVLVWVTMAVAGWALTVGIGYLFYEVGDKVMAILSGESGEGEMTAEEAEKAGEIAPAAGGQGAGSAPLQ